MSRVEMGSSMTQEERDFQNRTWESLVDAVLSARDFCGNEFEAFADVCHDFRMEPSMELYGEILVEADKRWDACRQAARASS